jgi:hypothetical protein
MPVQCNGFCRITAAIGGLSDQSTKTGLVIVAGVGNRPSRQLRCYTTLHPAACAGYRLKGQTNRVERFADTDRNEQLQPAWSLADTASQYLDADQRNKITPRKRLLGAVIRRCRIRDHGRDVARNVCRRRPKVGPQYNCSD